MKKTLLFLSIVAVTILAVSCKKTNLDGITIIRGGGGVGSGIVHIYPDFFKRNNGNGTCGGAGQIRAEYNTCPTDIPTITRVYNLNSNGTITPIDNLTFGQGETAPCVANHSYISYCFFGGNIPPITKVVLELEWADGFSILLNSEGDPYTL